MNVDDANYFDHVLQVVIDFSAGAMSAIVAKSSSAPILRCGPIQLNDELHLVTLDEEVVELSPTEYRLLQYLMEHKGKVLSKTTLLSAVWEIDFDSESTVVDTYISYLRKKLNRENLEFIRTVRGVGFQLVEPK